MATSDEFILKHAAAPYDPVKRREYYLRTRKLKGRKKGKTDIPNRRPPTQARPVGNGKPNASATKPGGKPLTPAAKRREETKARLKALSERLENLRTVLRKLVAEAQRSSGVDPVKKTEQRETSSKKSETKPRKQTTSEKRESAKRSKEYYDKNVKKPPSLNRQEKQLQTEIERVQKRIYDVRARLKTVVDDAKRSHNKTDNKKPRPSS